MNLPEDFVFSQSSLQDYVDCPRRFELRYLLRQRWPAAEVDDMLEFEQRAEQGKQFHQLVHQHIIGLPAEVLRPHIDDDDVRCWFEVYLRSETPPGQLHPELTLTVPLDRYWLLAKFDLLAVTPGEQALIIDWKTARKLPDPAWTRDRLQTVVYRLVLALGGDHLNGGQPLPPDHITMRYWFAEHDGATQAFAYDAAQFKADLARVTGLVQAIATRRDFPLTDDPRHCRFCVYRSLCNRGESAGSLAEWDALDTEFADLSDFQIDLDQIAEIEF